MNWAPILIGIAIICYTFAMHIILLHTVNICAMCTIPRRRTWDNIFTVSLGFCSAIALATIGTVALCYL